MPKTDTECFIIYPGHRLYAPPPPHHRTKYPHLTIALNAALSGSRPGGSMLLRTLAARNAAYVVGRRLTAERGWQFTIRKIPSGWRMWRTQ